MADPNRSAAFLHPLQEDSCLAAVGKDLGAGKLALGYSLFMVVRAHLMKARDDSMSPSSTVPPLIFYISY
jgi:hypothetical protein